MKIETLRNLLKLAKDPRTPSHEADIARQKLYALLEKYGVTLEMLLNSQKEWYQFTVTSKEERLLLTQCAFYVTNSSRIQTKRTKGNTKKIELELTPSQFIDVSVYYAHYRRLWKQTLAAAIEAFCLKNGLYNQEGEGASESTMTPEQKRRLREMYQAMRREKSPLRQLVKGDSND